jgi:DNA processing protein
VVGWLAGGAWRGGVALLAAQIRAWEARGVVVATPADAAYPRRLVGDVCDPLLFMRGRAPPAEHRHVGVVGSRAASPAGVRAARVLAKAVAAAGGVVVSGAARGIDAAALLATPPARAVIVSGVGPDRVYPPGSRPVFEAVARGGGLILSREPPGTGAAPWQFPARNRLIARLCDDLIVVQAGARSGALLTAERARQLGRSVYVWGGEARGLRGAGAEALLDTGEAQELRDPGDLWQSSARCTEAMVAPASPREALSQRLLGLVAAGCDTVGQVVVASGSEAGPGEVQATLTALEMDGVLMREGERLRIAEKREAGASRSP